MSSIIYKITNKINKKSYIGQTIKSLSLRWQKHCSDSKKDNVKIHFHKAIKKYTENMWTLEILEEVSDINLLNEREIYWITHYDTFKNGYNSDTGGKNGRIISEETKEKISKSNKGKIRTKSQNIALGQRMKLLIRTEMWNENISKGLLGKPRSDETKRKISDSHKGLKPSEETRKKLSESARNRVRTKKIPAPMKAFGLNCGS